MPRPRKNSATSSRAADANPPATSPCPDRYCPVEHGDVLFPEALLALPPGDDSYAHLALVKRKLCRNVGIAGFSCSPERCRERLAERAGLGAGGTVNACKLLWSEYYERNALRSGGDAPGWSEDYNPFDIEWE